ncbi:MAG: c-type cytochrome [Vicinamibacterales bacterium]
MTQQTCSIAITALLTASMTGVAIVRAAGQAPPQAAPAAGQTAPAAPAGRGADPAARGAGAGQGGARGGGRGGFAQFTRPVASADVLVRGKSLYEANCASCHAVDLRGTADGKFPNLLRSGTALNDKQGELIGASIGKHAPAITLTPTDSLAIAEYIHSVHATMGGQGSPPGRNPTGELNILVGDPAAGQAYFSAACSTCHSLTGDLEGIGSKYTDPRALQNAWVAGSSGRFGGGGGGRGGGGNPVTVTMADGSKLTGALIRNDDWLVVLMLPDGTRKSIARNNGIPKVDVTDPNEAHKKMVLELDDANNKKMHDVTAYLWTVK